MKCRFEDIIDICPLEVNLDIEYLYLMKMLKVSENLILKTKKSLKDEIESFTINPAFFVALDEATYEEINEQVQNVSSDAFIKDIHSLGFWYLK